MTNVNRYARPVSDVEDALARYDDGVYSLASHGGGGQSFWFAPSGGLDQLRVDVDFETDRAMVTWLPAHVYGVELEPAEALTIEWSTDAELAVIPAEFARVSVATARQAVAEYLSTGERPTCIRWEKQPPGQAFLATSTSSEFGPF